MSKIEVTFLTEWQTGTLLCQIYSKTSIICTLIVQIILANLNYILEIIDLENTGLFMNYFYNCL